MVGDQHPQGVPYSVNYPEIPVYLFLENSARKYPDRTALIFFGRRISYRKLWELSRRLASSIKGLGVERGDRVGLLLPNIPQFVISYYAILAAGGVVVAVNPLNEPDEVDRELRVTGVDTLITLDRFSDKIPIREIRDVVVADSGTFLPWPVKIIDRIKHKRTKARRKIGRFNALLKEKGIEKGEELDVRRDLAAIQFTGGTMGSPKGVMLTHHNLVANTLQTFYWLRGWGYSAKPQPAGWPVVACALPFFHIYGMTVALNEGIHFGSSLALIPDPRPEAIMKVIERCQATHLPAIPEMIRGIVEHPSASRFDLTSLTSCVIGGGPIEPAIAKSFVDITGAELYQGYGLTEASPVSHCTPLGCEKLSSVGLALPDTEFKIVDLQTGDIEVPSGVKGELLIRGPQVMAGYWNEPEMTAWTLNDGWLHTGDIAHVDTDGFLYIVDRKDNKIVARGHTIWPSQIEGILESHPAVKGAAVLGIPDPLRCATEIGAVVTLNQGWSSLKIERALMELCRHRLKPFQVPSRIYVMATLPRTSMGRIDRKAIRRMET